MISRTEFICRFMDRFNHKTIQVLEEKLPKEGILQDMIIQANEIIHCLTKEG